MTGSKKKVEGSSPIHKIKTEKDVYITARDGVRLALDIYRPDDKGKFPALLAYGPYGKELQALSLNFPPCQSLKLLHIIPANNINYSHYLLCSLYDS